MIAAPFFRIRDLSVGYRRAGGRLAALTGVDLDLPVGQRLAIIGESGSGKSTLAMAAAGLLPPEAEVTGEITHPGLGHALRRGADIGVVFQDPAGSLNPVLTVGSQIAEVVRAHRQLTERQARDLAVELVRRVRIPDAEERVHGYPHEFSGGQRQRLAIAAALAGRPQALVADEPTSALDTVAQREIVDLIDRLVIEERLTLILVTHDIALASERADMVAVLYAGRLVEAGPIGETLRRPRHPYTRALIATHLSLGGPRPLRLPEIAGAPPDLASPPGGCRFAPRCPLAHAACAVDPPWTGVVGDGAACHRLTAEVTA